MSRRLRPCGLLLLLPVLMANTPPSLAGASSPLAATTAPDHIVLEGLPNELLLYQCVKLTAALRDSSGNPATTSGAVQVQLYSTLMGGAFYPSEYCSAGTEIAGVTIAAGTSSQFFWYRATVPGAVTISASDGAGGLSDALSRLLSVVALPTLEFRLEMSAAPQVGVPIELTVSAKNASGVATGYSGTIQFYTKATGVTLPANYTFTPNDAGVKKFTLTFMKKGVYELTVTDTANTQLLGRISSFEVLTGPAVAFTMNLPTDVTAGEPVEFKVVPVDADNNPTTYLGAVHFTTTVPKAELPIDTPNDAPLPVELTVTFFTASSMPQEFRITDLSSGRGSTGTSQVVVHPAALKKVELTPSPDDEVPACGPVTITLTPKDEYDNVVDETLSGASLCKAQDSSATFDSTTLKAHVVSGDCVTGVLTGSAQVVWKDMKEENVEFKFSGANVDGPLVIHWKAGLPSIETSTFRFLQTSELRPELRTYTGELKLELARRDLCGTLVPLAAGSRLSFAGDEPLALGNPATEVEPGRWLLPVRLPQCPADPSVPLAIWPLINDHELYLPDGKRAERFVTPLCLPPLVQLQLLNEGAKRFAAPGTVVEFEVTVSNSGDAPITDGVLMLSGNGLMSLEPIIDDKPLTPSGEGFTLPELSKGSPVTVKITAQASTQSRETLEALVWCVNASGDRLTEQQTVSFAPDDSKVDVGCGCHAAALPSQLFPWLALLMAASRPWKRLRRLRRGERNGL
ncbi:hypothetical protein [Hyalangium versicolor]|uniref:hypothetical protein n=1 Tax=Hyalangium versicolor TaxID=2861190 RepID=UPI001CCE5441|nr:hypothetical protein [Hyalangium versicolor]